MAMEDGPIRCPETSATIKLLCVTSQKMENLIYTVMEDWNHARALLTFCRMLRDLVTSGVRQSGSVVGIATAYGLDGPGIESRWGRDFLPLSRPALRPS